MNNEEYERDLVRFVKSSQISRPEFVGNYYRWPILNEDTQTTAFDEQYLYHTHWALRKIWLSKTRTHLDFSSSLNFISACSVFSEVSFYDYRPPVIHITNLTCNHTDLTKFDESINPQASVSCMHVIEHIGLGRYGDILDPTGDLKAIHNLTSYVQPGGKLLFVVPVGQPAVWFNAHRVYDPTDVVSYFAESFKLEEFFFIPSDLKNPPIITTDLTIANRYRYACGCFEFTRVK